MMTLPLPPLQPKTAMLASMGLGLLVAVALIYAAAQWRSDWVLAHQPAPKVGAINTADETVTMIAAIPANHLFGKAFSEGNVPTTNLQLKVTGIVKVPDDHADAVSKAYISISGQPSKIYEVGDQLPNGVKIYSITRDTVILENEGALEKLPLPREALEFKPRNSMEQP